jgi:Xaa-Pro aminopeptidase
MDAGRAALIERTRAALAADGIAQALLCSPETVAQLTGFEVPWEDWPVADPFTAAPPMLFLTLRDAILVVPTLFAVYAGRGECEVVETRTYRFRGTPPDPFAELESTLASLPWSGGPVGVEGKWLTGHAADVLRRRGLELRWVDQTLIEARRRKSEREVESVRAACAVADMIQQAVKDLAEPGQTEAELAALALSAATARLEHRFPALLTIDSGENTALGSSIPSARRLAAGELVLSDTSPWIDGGWSDTASTIVLGPPTAEHRRAFDAVRRSLDLAISLCRPGAVAGEIDARVRASLSDWGDTVYKHHTGHGLGASWNELPRVIPGGEEVIEEGMVIAVEPGLYVPGWGGLRLEHVFVVKADGNELLSRFEHTL